MDFTPSEDQQAIIDLATRIVGDHTTADRLREQERAGRHHDARLWSALAEADLLGISMAESAGGGGFGLLEAALVAEVAGAHVAPIPYVDAVAAGRLLARCHDPLAAAVGEGTVVVPALREGADARETDQPGTRASADDGTWTLTGEKRLVTGAAAAAAYVATAAVGAEVGLFLVDAGDITTQHDSASMTGQVLRTIRLDATPARRLPTDDGVRELGALRRDLRILRCAHLSGVAAGAVRIAADHCKEREQFGAPIGTFQAVAHRMADAWLDANLMQATYRQAAWRSDHDLPAGQAAASASLWACEGVQRVVHAAQHVHGGVGVDLDYPIHRYFRWAKDMELQLGGASTATRDLGAAIAAEPLTIG